MIQERNCAIDLCTYSCAFWEAALHDSAVFITHKTSSSQTAAISHTCMEMLFLTPAVGFLAGDHPTGGYVAPISNTQLC